MPPEPAATNDIERARQRVTIGPLPEWAVLPPVDESWRAPGGAGYSLLLRDEQHHAGQSAVFLRQAWRLETLQSVQDASQWKYGFDPVTQRISLHTLSVRRNGAQAEHAVLEKLRFIQRESSLESLVLDGAVSLLLLLEDVRVGDVLEMALTITEEPRTFAGRCWAMAFPWTHQPMRAWRWSVRFAPPRAMRWKSSGTAFAPEIRELPTGETEWLWSLEKTTAEPEEPGTPSSCLPARWLQISDFASWEEVAAGVLATWPEDFDSPQVRNFVADIAAHAPNLAERIERALTIIQDDIRYLSVNIELGGTIPSPPGSVLQRRFGDCKDKSFLLAHVLRCLGAPARPVLIHTKLRSTIGELLPTPAFNHVVVEFELENRRMWVDPTIPLQGGDAFSRWIPNYGLGLPIGPGVTALEALPTSRKAGRLTLHESFSIDEAAGQSRLRMILRATGAEADLLRQRLLMHSPEAFGEERTQFYRQFFPGARLVGSVEWREHRRLNEITVGLLLALPVTGARSEDASLSTFSYFAHLIRSGLAMPSSESRKAPLQIANDPTRWEHIIEMVGAPGRSLASAGVNSTHDAFSFSASRENRGGSLVMSFVLHIHQDQLRPRDLKGYRAQLEKTWHATSVQLAINRGMKSSVGARKAGIFPAERQEKPIPAPFTVEPVPLEPVAALGPRAALPGAKLRGAIEEAPAPPVPRLRPPAPLRELGAEEPAPSPRKKRRGRSRARKSSSLGLVLFLTAAAALVVLIYIMTM